MLCSQEDNQVQCGRCGFVGPLVHFLILPFPRCPETLLGKSVAITANII